MSNSDPNSLPDTAAPQTPLPAQWSAYEDEEEYYLGAEAALPEGLYGPTIPSRLPDPSLQRRTLRELERRVRGMLSPAFPVEVQRVLPGAALLDGYRRFALRSRSLTVDSFGRDPAYCRQVRPALDFLYKHWLRVDMQGLENVPAQRSAILVCNHTGALPFDASMLMHGMQQSDHSRLLRPLLEDRVFHSPFLGVFLRRLGAVRACQENATRLLDEGALIAVFPEGRRAALKKHRSQHQLERFGRGGFVRLALQTGSPLLPVAIIPGPGHLDRIATNRIQLSRLFGSRAELIPSASRWTIAIGEPIDLSAELDESEWHNRAIVAEQANRIRSQIHDIICNVVPPTS